MQNVIPLLKGMPVLLMRRGVFPNKSEILDVMQSYPGYIVAVEPAAQRFAITVRSNNHVRCRTRVD